MVKNNRQLIQNNPHHKPLSLIDRLNLISLIDEGMRHKHSNSPILSDFFNDLWDLIDNTISGSKMFCLKPEDSLNGFHQIDLNADSGENLGRMNMIYLNKPVPCYYLVYVEVSQFLRRKGLGTRILEYFNRFLGEKSAIGILDNIIPVEDPTFDFYRKQGWNPVTDIIGTPFLTDVEDYMIYIPSNLSKKELKAPVQKLLYHLSRKREMIHMRDNEIMVKQTIDEFRALHTGLMTYFNVHLLQGGCDANARFFFTKFVTKLIAFRRKIGELIGYTGGESIEQITLAPMVASWPIQSYVPADLAYDTSSISGNFELLSALPRKLLKQPSPYIESLPNYLRPSLRSWIEKKKSTVEQPFTIGDLMELGFDPTRLKEMTVKENKYIIERMPIKKLKEIQAKQKLLDRIAPLTNRLLANGTLLKVNPPLLIIQDQGNAYILRNKIEAIHWDEALEQTQTHAALKELNQTIKLDKLIRKSLKTAVHLLSAELTLKERDALDTFSWFVSWNLETNQPRLLIDFSEPYFDSIWMA